ncbi:MAG: hypothetical protein IPP93_13240 [Chitinophagaceae bacterium]|nr:hypothetical protein [Chitinophagaceae bacterium]
MFRHFYFIFVICVLTSQVLTAQTNPEQKKLKKVNVLPVCFSVNNIPGDTAVLSYFQQSFARYKVKLISKEEFKQLNETEMQRVKQQMLVPGTSYSNSESVSESISKLQHYVSNLLSVGLNYQRINDSIVVISATWHNAPFPPDFSSSSSLAHQETFVFENTSAALREKADLLLDKILHSGFLK